MSLQTCAIQKYLLPLYIRAAARSVSSDVRTLWFAACQVVHLTFLELLDQPTLPATTSSESLSSIKAYQISISTLMTSLNRAGAGSTGAFQALPSSSQTAMRLASLSLAFRSAASHALQLCSFTFLHLYKTCPART